MKFNELPKLFSSEKVILSKIEKKNVSAESHAAEKRQLVNEIVSLKKMADLHDRDSARRDLQVHQYKSEADKGLTALQDAERKVQNYRVEVRCSFNF